jgi:hypothetical protein
MLGDAIPDWPTLGNWLTMTVSFGGPDNQLMYEVLEPLTYVVDRGGTATLTFTGGAKIIRGSP